MPLLSIQLTMYHLFNAWYTLSTNIIIAMAAVKVSSQNNISMSISIDNDNDDDDDDDLGVGRQQEVQSIAPISSLWSGCTSVNIPSSRGTFSTSILDTRSILSFVNGMIMISEDELDNDDSNTSVGGNNINSMVVKSVSHHNVDNDEEEQVYEIPIIDTRYSNTDTNESNTITTIHNNNCNEIEKKKWHQSSDSDDTVDTQADSTYESDHSSSDNGTTLLTLPERYALSVAQSPVKHLYPNQFLP